MPDGIRFTETDLSSVRRGAEWHANMRYAAAALMKNGVAELERAEFLALFERYRSEIVEAC